MGPRELKHSIYLFLKIYFPEQEHIGLYFVETNAILIKKNKFKVNYFINSYYYRLLIKMKERRLMTRKLIIPKIVIFLYSFNQGAKSLG